MKTQTASIRSSKTGFTVVGFYPDSEQRFCDFFVASSAIAAEQKCQRTYPGLAVCGVFKGHHIAVDCEDYVSFSN